MLLDMKWFDLLGSVGVLLIICSYFLLMIRRISSTSLTYSALNAVGAALILISLTQNFNMAAFLIELFWLIISIIGIALSIRSRIGAEGNNIKI